jgi:hypothetical protein
MTDIAIRTENLSKTFGSTEALVNLNLDVPAGEVLGYLGPNGAGKTTTIRLLLGLVNATRGRADIFGVDCQADPVEAHRRVAYVPGEANLWPSLTGAETLHLLGRVQGTVDTAYRDALRGRCEGRRLHRLLPATARQAAVRRPRPPGQLSSTELPEPYGPRADNPVSYSPSRSGARESPPSNWSATPSCSATSIWRSFEVNRDQMAARLAEVICSLPGHVPCLGRGCGRCEPGGAGLPGCGRNMPGEPRARHLKTRRPPTPNSADAVSRATIPAALCRSCFLREIHDLRSRGRLDPGATRMKSPVSPVPRHCLALITRSPDRNRIRLTSKSPYAVRGWNISTGLPDGSSTRT